MAESNLDAVVLTSEPNMLYLSGYSAISLERLLSLIVFREHERACLILPRLEESRAEESCRIPDVEFISYSDVEDPVAILKEVLARNRIEKSGRGRSYSVQVYTSSNIKSACGQSMLHR